MRPNNQLPASIAAIPPTVAKSPLELAIDAFEPKLHEFEVNGFFGLAEAPIYKIAFRVARKDEETAAYSAAHAYISKAASGNDAAKSDEDIVRDAKLGELLFRVCRNPDDPKYPVFSGPEWMRKNLTTDHIATLMNLYLSVRAAEGTGPSDIADITVEAVLELANKHARTDIPDAFLAGMSREYVNQIVILSAVKLDAARDAEAAPICLWAFLSLLEMCKRG